MDVILPQIHAVYANRFNIIMDLNDDHDIRIITRIQITKIHNSALHFTKALPQHPLTCILSS